MKSLELLVERIILSSRWLLVVFYLGLVAALAVYAFSFALKFLKVAKNVFTYDEADMILAMLGLIDAALTAQVLQDAGLPVVQQPDAMLPMAAPGALTQEIRPLREQVAELERQAITRALALCGGNKLLAARWLGISRAKLYDRLPELSGNKTFV